MNALVNYGEHLESLPFSNKTMLDMSKMNERITTQLTI